MNVLREIKQLFCKHEMEKVHTYETKVIEKGKIIKCEKLEQYVCSKCGKEESKLLPQFIPHFVSRYNDL